MTEARKKLIEAIYREFNFTKDVSEQHPDWIFIKEKIAGLDEGDLVPFYSYLMSKKREKGQMKRWDFASDAENFINERMSAIWSDMNLEERSRKMAAKLKTLAEALEPYGRQKAGEAIKSMDLTQVKITNRDKSVPLFLPDEIELIDEIGRATAYDKGREYFLGQLSGICLAREYIEPAWKRLVIRKRAGRKTLLGATTGRSAGTREAGEIAKVAVKKISLL